MKDLYYQLYRNQIEFLDFNENLKKKVRSRVNNALPRELPELERKINDIWNTLLRLAPNQPNATTMKLMAESDEYKRMIEDVADAVRTKEQSQNRRGVAGKKRKSRRRRRKTRRRRRKTRRRRRKTRRN